MKQRKKALTELWNKVREKMLVDVCVWAKNGERFLPIVLKRIDDVIGRDINQKIFVDDSSTDRSVEIAESFGWTVYPNREGWICGGKKEALRHVETEFFVSVEQDLLLARNWWATIQKYMEDKNVAVAQGIRFSTNPIFHASEEYAFKNINRPYFSTDNNLYRTKIIKQLGFSDDIVAMAPFYWKVVNSGYKWIVDTNLISDHLRTSLLDDIRHRQRFYATTKIDTFVHHTSMFQLLLSLLFSLKFIRTRNAFVFLTQTLVRYSNILAYVTARGQNETQR